MEQEQESYDNTDTVDTVDTVDTLMRACAAGVTTREQDDAINTLLQREPGAILTVCYTHADTHRDLQAWGAGGGVRRATNPLRGAPADVIARLRTITMLSNIEYLALALAILAHPRVQMALVATRAEDIRAYVMGTLARNSASGAPSSWRIATREAALAEYDRITHPHADQWAHIAALRDEANAIEARLV